MVGTNVKAETMDLMEKRTAMEAEMNAIIDNLCRPGGPGLSGNLLDSEVSFYLDFFSTILFDGLNFGGMLKIIYVTK